MAQIDQRRATYNKNVSTTVSKIRESMRSINQQNREYNECASITGRESTDGGSYEHPAERSGDC